MNEQDRLAALLLQEFEAMRWPHVNTVTAGPIAARLIASGVRVDDAGLDVERLVRALRHIAFGGGSDAIDDGIKIDVGFLSCSGESSVRDIAAAIAREYAALREEP